MASNLEKSEVVIARILKLLMDRGLQDSMMTFGSLELSDDYEPFFKTSFVWLMHEGFIRATSNSEFVNSAFHGYGPVLTAKGFAMLGNKLELNGEQITIASAVEETSKSGVSASGLGDFFGGLLGGFTKSISS